jgi:preprotein translocase subunit SecF
MLEVKFENYNPSIAEIQDGIKEVNLSSLTIQPTEDSYILRFVENSEESHALVVSELKKMAEEKEGASFKELQFDAVGPSIGKELKSKSFNASILAILMIALYIAISFRKVSLPVASWKYGVSSIIALAHDIIIALGFFAFMGHFYGTEVNTTFIAAILTILGYSINDTIVVFDRIRDNLPKSQETFENTVNISINQTLIRSLNTSLTVILSLLAIYFFGGDSIKDFALALIVGVISGTYSSIFVASPVLVIWDNITRAKKRKVAAK